MVEAFNDVQLAKESVRLAKQMSREFTVQHRTVPLLAALVSLPGSDVPIRLPDDDGTSLLPAGYPDFSNPREGEPVPTLLLGLYGLKNRRSTLFVLQGFERKGLVTRTQGGRKGAGCLWKPTSKGIAVYERALEVFNDDGYDFTGRTITGFDRNSGLDRFGVDYNGYKSAEHTDENYVGIGHIFHNYYGPSYAPHRRRGESK